MRELEVRVLERNYTLTTEAETAKRVRMQVGRLDRHAHALSSELGFVSESLLILMAAVQALDEVESAVEEQDKILVESSNSIHSISRQIRELAAELSA